MFNTLALWVIIISHYNYLFNNTIAEMLSIEWFKATILFLLSEPLSRKNISKFGGLWKCRFHKSTFEC